MGLGLLGLLPKPLYSLTFEEFANAVRGKTEHLEQTERSNWERTRWQTALLLNVHTKKGSSLKPIDLTIFPWEKEREKNKPQTDGFAILRAMAKAGKNG